MHFFRTRMPLAIAIILVFFFISCDKNPSQPDLPESQAEPVLAFSWAGEQAAPADITFTSHSLYAASLSWNFGNGQTSGLAAPPKVRYDAPGTYEVVLMGRNGTKTILLKKTIVISPNADPVAQFSWSYNGQRSYAPATINLVNGSVNADAWEWTINGTTQHAKTPQPVVFQQAGNYEIALVAIKGSKRSAIFKEMIVVDANNDPVARFALNYHPYPYIAGEEIQFVNLSTNSDAWQWTFGTGGPAASSEQHPLVKFALPGTYLVTLVAKKNGVSSPPRSVTIKINP